MAASAEWDDNKIRQCCIDGTKKQLQAYLDQGHIQLSGFPLDASHISELKAPKKSYPQLPRPRIGKADKKNPVSVESYLSNDFSGHNKMIEVAEAVCTKHGVTMAAMVGNGRCRELVVARRELFYICYFKLGKSTSQIGKAFNKDHTTIVHHLQVCTGKRNVNYFRAGMDNVDLCT